MKRRKGCSKIKVSKHHETWLTIGIPTVPRPNGVDYLSPTLNSINEMLPIDTSDPFYGKILVVVVNHSKLKHESFEKNKEKYNKNPHFKFLTRKPIQKSITPSAISTNVKLQSLDVADVLNAVEGSSKYFLFMEDDFKLCPNGIKSLYHLISKTNLYHPDWIAIRCSFGLNGIIYHNNQDLKRFTKYLLDHFQRRPPDHLIVEFSASETPEALAYAQRRPIVGYRYNIFDHLGKISTLRKSSHWSFPKCYDELVYPVTFEVEAFNPKQCPNDDIWPCKGKSSEVNRWIKWNL